METKNLGTAYDLPTLEWDTVLAQLNQGYTLTPGTKGPDHFTTWLTTLDADGAPHTVAVGALWIDGAFWFQAGQKSRKGQNVARDPRCTMAISMETCDLTVSGPALRVTDPALVAQAAQAWTDQGWPAEPAPSGTEITAPYNAPSAGPGPWSVYRIEPAWAVVVSTTEPGGATSWTF